MQRSMVGSVAVMAAGALLGWALASGSWDFSPKAEATGNDGELPREAKPCGEGTCGEASRSATLAVLAAHNQQVAAKAQQEGKKPNIVIIWVDDIGQSNISAYSMGLMGYRTPNIDRIAREGMMFTDYYG